MDKILTDVVYSGLDALGYFNSVQSEKVQKDKKIEGSGSSVEVGSSFKASFEGALSLRAASAVDQVSNVSAVTAVERPRLDTNPVREIQTLSPVEQPGSPDEVFASEETNSSLGNSSTASAVGSRLGKGYYMNLKGTADDSLAEENSRSQIQERLAQAFKGTELKEKGVLVDLSC